MLERLTEEVSQPVRSSCHSSLVTKGQDQGQDLPDAEPFSLVGKGVRGIRDPRAELTPRLTVCQHLLIKNVTVPVTRRLIKDSLVEEDVAPKVRIRATETGVVLEDIVNTELFEVP